MLKKFFSFVAEFADAIFQHILELDDINMSEKFVNLVKKCDKSGRFEKLRPYLDAFHRYPAVMKEIEERVNVSKFYKENLDVA